MVRSTALAGSRSNPSSKASPRRLDAPRRVISPAVSNVYFGSSGQGADQVVAKPDLSGSADDLTVHVIAHQERVSANYVYRLLRLPTLAPDIITAIINGKNPPQL